MTNDRTIGEKCGVVGVFTKAAVAPFLASKASASLQHRGQESAGITVLSEKGKLETHVGMGLVPHVLTESVLQKIGVGMVAISHNRYSTTGNSSLANAQPFTFSSGKFAISIAHNGNIPDAQKFFPNIKNAEEGISDTGLLALTLVSQRQKHTGWDDALVSVLSHVPAAYSLVMMTEDGAIYGARDNYGIRPLVLGKLQDGWIIASETVALDAVGAVFLREVSPGELLKISPTGELSSSFFGKPQHKQPDLFEHIYFARPDSFMNGIRVRFGREQSGKRLGKRILEKKIDVDVVVPIFDSGYPAAKGVAEALKKPLVEAITTSHYVGRTFIRPEQKNRIAAVNGKHNFTPDAILGKRVVFVDDSAVRLTTSSFIVKGLRNAGATSVTAAFASPPVVNHCDMGIDMKSKTELPASMWEHEGFDAIEKHASEYIGADDVVYLPVVEAALAFGERKREDFYHTPFGGPHPLRDQQKTFLTLKKKIPKVPKIVVLISGNGSNLENIIEHIEKKQINAQIVEVIANKEDAYGLTRAKDHGITTNVFSSAGIIKNTEKRKEYDRKLLAHIKKLDVDLVVLAGWMLVLSDEFLETLEKNEIPVINIHPALLTSDEQDTVVSSRGVIPVVKGAHAIEEAFKNPSMLATGVSVHQVLAKKKFDVGPVIIKEEVRKIKDESLQELTKKIHEAEYRVYPVAISRVLHVLQSGINICDGEFVW